MMQRRGTSVGWFFAVVVVAGLAVATTLPAADSPAAPPGTVAGAPAAAAPDPAKKVAEPQPPVQISADTAEYFNKEGFVVFTGNVVVIQADATITADRMEVTFEKPDKPEGQPAQGLGSPANAQRITKIVAQQKVNFRQVDPETKRERFATGDKGVYDVDQQTVTMTGNPRVWEGKNVIVGDEMVFHLADKKMNVKGKVNLTVYPDDLKEKKKP